jgi:hypothetical protein
MLESTTVGGLRATFTMLAEKKTHITDTELLALQRRVSAAVDEMKAAGALPERVIIAIKGLASDTGVQWSDNELFSQLATWCVDRYYAEPDA